MASHTPMTAQPNCLESKGKSTTLWTRLNFMMVGRRAKYKQPWAALPDWSVTSLTTQHGPQNPARRSGSAPLPNSVRRVEFVEILKVVGDNVHWPGARQARPSYPTGSPVASTVPEPLGLSLSARERRWLWASLVGLVTVELQASNRPPRPNSKMPSSKSYFLASKKR